MWDMKAAGKHMKLYLIEETSKNNEKSFTANIRSQVSLMGLWSLLLSYFTYQKCQL